MHNCCICPPEDKDLPGQAPLHTCHLAGGHREQGSLSKANLQARPGSAWKGVTSKVRGHDRVSESQPYEPQAESGPLSCGCNSLAKIPG